MPLNYDDKLEVLDADIDGGTDSAIIPLGGRTVVGVYVPASVASSTLTFSGSIDGGSGTMKTIKDYTDGADVTLTISGEGIYYLDPVKFVCAEFLQINASNSETTKEYKLLVRPVS